MRRTSIAMKGLLATGIVWLYVLTCPAQRQIEDLDRGLLAIRTGNGVYLSWRILGQEYLTAAYNIYRESTLLNAEPVTGASNYLDPEGTTGAEYSVAAVIDGVEQAKSTPVTVWAQNYLSIPIQQPPGGTRPDGDYTYNANDISAGDLDGDGQYELVLKWDPSDSHDNSQSGYTGNVFLDAYELDGTRLWRIDLGLNIRAGAHYTQFMVYDLDGDGKAEVACKTADGTRDGTGMVIGDSTADYRNSSGYILAGPEFLTIFNGETGAAMATTDYIPQRGSVSSWGDSYGNRVDRFLACIAYLDGLHPSLVMCRGYYTRMVLAAWDWRDGTLSSRWVFDTRNGYSSYEGQGNHNLSVADLDEDGKDEIIYGACAIDDDGTGMWNTGLHHGDALHVSDIDPDRPGLEVWGIHEGTGIGCALLDGKTGQIIWHGANGDVGRGVSADLTAARPGMECWGGTNGLRSAAGEYIGSYPSSSNFLVWWDGDDLRELLDGVSVSKYGAGTIFSASFCVSNNGTKSTPGISADLLGDWHEEIIWRAVDNHSLRLYASTTPTNRRLYTLMHDPQYRLSIAWQNVGYNQPPHTGFFLGHNMTPPPPPPIVRAKLRWSGGSEWDLSSKNWMHADSLTVFNNGDDVLFDLSGSDADPISLTGSLSPSNLTVYAPQDYILDGPGSLTGSMELLKAGAGKLVINSDNDFSGKTRIWQGSLMLNGSLQCSAEVYKDAEAGGSGIFGNGLTLHTRGILIIGPGRNSPDTLSVSNGLVTEGEAKICFDLSDDSTGLVKPNDVLMISGDLHFSGKTSFEFQLLDGTLQQGLYELIHYTGTFSGDLDSVSCTGLEKFPYRLIDTGNAIALNILKLRSQANIVWQGGSPNDWDLADHLNWLNGDLPDWFVPGDTVTFNDEGISNNTVNLVGVLSIGKVIVDASGDYSLEGDGYMFGEGDLVKEGDGSLKITGLHEYTGPTLVNGGILEITELKNGGLASAIGASSADAANLLLNGGKLRITGPSSSNRGISIGTKGGSLDLPSGSSSLLLSGTITGDGHLDKTGDGELTLSAANDWSGGFLVEGGTIRLGSEEANLGGLGTGKVTLQDASLEMLDDRNSYTDNCQWNLVVPQGSESWLYLDSRCSLAGSLEGGGILNVRVPYIRSMIMGDWSAFSGKIRVSTDYDDAWFLPGSPYGFKNAAIELSDNVTIIYSVSEDAAVHIGNLSGSSGSELGAGGEGSNNITWVVGELNTNAEFDGQITDRQFKNSGATASIIKTGSGNWTLSNSNSYSGTTEIEGGILILTNTNGHATGNGDVYVRSGGAIRGNGSIGGRLSVENQGSVTVGTGSGIDILTVDNDAEFLPGSYLSLKINPGDKTADRLIVNGHLKFEGILYITTLNPGTYAPGENYQIFDADTASGSFNTIIPAAPGEGLEWDTTWLAEYGFLHIAVKGNVGTDDVKNSLTFTIYPNPGRQRVELDVHSLPGSNNEVMLRCYDQQGRQMLRRKWMTDGPVSTASIDVGQWPPGIYVFVLETNERIHIRKFLKQ